MSTVSKNTPKHPREGSQADPRQKLHMNTVEHIHRNQPAASWKAASARRRFRRVGYKRQTVRSFVGILLTAAILSAQDFPDVTKISLEDLMNVKVTSVSKREQ